MATIHDPIKAEIAAGHTSAALAMIDERMAHDDEADRAGLLYLKGRAYMKAGGLKADLTYRHTYI